MSTLHSSILVTLDTLKHVASSRNSETGVYEFQVGEDIKVYYREKDLYWSICDGERVVAGNDFVRLAGSENVEKLNNYLWDKYRQEYEEIYIEEKTKWDSVFNSVK